MRQIWDKWKVQLLCIAGGFLLYAAAAASAEAESDVSGGYLKRSGYGEEAASYEFLVDGLGEEPVVCEVEVAARRYSEEEARQVFEAILDGLPEQMKGENEDLSRVETDLTLPVSFEEQGVKAEWYSDAPDILDAYGQIMARSLPEDGVSVWLTAALTDGEHEAERTYPVTVYPRHLTEQQRWAEAIAEEIQKEDARDPTGAAVKLPETYDGHVLRYRQEDESYRIIPLLGILAAVLLYARDLKKGDTTQKKRKTQLMLDYADVVYQLMVFVGAGLTVGRAWERIVLNYEERRKQRLAEVRPAYEEMAYAQAQIECGTPEGEAIAEFGQRCRLQSYLKLSGLLEQNRRTGTKNLTQLLDQEMKEAWEQQKNTARRLGEEAGTKLLLPLMLMLIVVMVIIMVPAMMSMG